MKKGRHCGKNILKDQRGFALISVYLVSMVVLILSTAAFASVLVESRLIDREITRTQASSAAEAGLQTALAQIGATATAYTGFINAASISSTPFQSATGTAAGSFSVGFVYDQMDWVILTSQGTVLNTAAGSPAGSTTTCSLEGRVFLQSNLSKYLMYANTSTLGLGSNLILGANDGINPQGVPANENERAALYYTNNLDFSGSNINIYGDTHAENFISGSNTNIIHGDTYVGGFTQDTQGRVTNDGINGTLLVNDGFNDDIDRDGNGIINANDYTDRHDLLTSAQQITPLNDDSRREEVIDQVNLAFYQAHNSSAATSRGYGTTTAERYFIFEPTADGTQTKVLVYNSQTQYNSAKSEDKVDEFTLPPPSSLTDKAILYNNGKAHVKGTIAGRVAVVSSDDILFDGNINYAGNSSYCSQQNSAAFMARDRVYFRPESLEVSGIIYADKAGSGTLAIDSDYNTSGQSRPQDKYDGHFRHFGNLIMDGEANTSNYYNDRAYVYDPNLKYYRPPGLPIRPELRTVREV